MTAGEMMHLTRQIGNTSMTESGTCQAILILFFAESLTLEVFRGERGIPGNPLKRICVPRQIEVQSGGSDL